MSTPTFPPPEVAVLVERLGPYHASRLSCLGHRLGPERVLAIEMAAESSTYAWSPVKTEDFRRHTLITDRDYARVGRNELARRTWAALEQERPQAVAVNGWGFPEARAALAWCRRRGRPSVLMSDSQERDEPRHWLKEWVKSGIVSEADAALVGGSAHGRYLARLGMPSGRVFRGFDTIDNTHFATGAAAARQNASRLRAELRLPERYFLAVARFVPKKNLPLLLEAFARYRATAGDASWDLVMVGDGPLRGNLEQRIRQQGLEGAVQLQGFLQYEKLPALYGLASAFILPSTSEQWGLVVNEAMAAGLPVAVSSACGSAEDLVQKGVNGWTFEPTDLPSLANLLAEIASCPALERMGRASQTIISRLDASAFGEGLLQALQVARSVRQQRSWRPWPNPLLWL